MLGSIEVIVGPFIPIGMNHIPHSLRWKGGGPSLRHACNADCESLWERTKVLNCFGVLAIAVGLLVIVGREVKDLHQGDGSGLAVLIPRRISSPIFSGCWIVGLVEEARYQVDREKKEKHG